MQKILWFDTETTGIDHKQNSIIQIAGVIEVDGEIKNEFELKCKPLPDTTISPGALEVTGYTEEQIYSFPDPNDLYKKLKSIFDKHIDKYDKSDKFIVAGYNIQFDLNMLDALFRYFGDKYLGSYLNYGCKIDVLPLVNVFRYLGHIKTDNAKLETICSFFNIEIKAHDAFSDIKATRELFFKLMEKYIIPMEQTSK